MRISCIILTLNGETELRRLHHSLQEQTFRFDCFVVDSSSKDGTQDFIRKCGHHLSVIHEADFNHGATRQMMVDLYPDYEFYVFLTQDVYLADDHAIERIIAPFVDPRVGAVCGRQLPHLNASLIAQHMRSFNYPSDSRVKSIDDVEELGIKTPFLSNSFAAYRRDALMGIGGFPKHVIFGEDMYVAAKLLMNGWMISYAADAVCYHSHNYSILEEFHRYFDVGVFHAREAWIRENFGCTGGEGLRFVISEMRFLGLLRFYLWPSALIRNACKYLAFKLGINEDLLPASFKRKLSMNHRFWGDSGTFCD